MKNPVNPPPQHGRGQRVVKVRVGPMHKAHTKASAEQLDELAAQRAYARADAWARSLPGTPYGSPGTSQQKALPAPTPAAATAKRKRGVR